MSAERSSLFLADYGVGTVYVSLPMEEMLRERLTIQKVQTGIHRGVLPDTPEISLITGQGDLAARFLVQDFRGIWDLGYPARPTDSPSHALVYNWVYSVPYQTNAPSLALTGQDASQVQFIVHLRVLRSFYAGDPLDAEERLVQHLRNLFGSIRLSIETSTGWSDLILNGSVDASEFPSVLNTLIRVNSLEATDGTSRRKAVFARTLTLFGLPWNGNEERIPSTHGGFKALIFVRSRPGQLDQVRSLLKEKFHDGGVVVNIVDGKLDVVGHVAKPGDDFFEAIVDIANNAGAESIARMETHLLFGPDDEPKEVDALKIPELRLHDCTCKTFIDGIDVPVCPGGVQQAVDNLLFLFRSTLQDPTNCCDVRPAIFACIKGLTRLMANYRAAMMRLSAWNGQSIKAPNSDVALASIVADITERRTKIERWVILCERVLRQRTIGSFDEFLGQSDRALFYRGGAQKMLLLADSLMNDFHARIAPRLRKSGRHVPGLEQPTFASLYDAVDRIESEIGPGLVRVPAGDVFLLAATLPDLWHEVGTHVFFRSFDDNDSGLDFTAGEEDVDAYGVIADCFGDLVVLVYGFRCDIPRFVVSVVRSWARSQADDDDAVKALVLPDLLERLVLAIEVVTYLQRPLSVERDHIVVTIWEIIKTHFSEKWQRKTVGSAAPHISQKVWKTLRGMLQEEGYVAMFNLLRRMIPEEDTINQVPYVTQRRNTGSALLRFGADEEINDVFADLYWKIHGSRSATKRFAETAAIGRSAVIEYHRRHGSGEKGASN